MGDLSVNISGQNRGESRGKKCMWMTSQSFLQMKHGERKRECVNVSVKHSEREKGVWGWGEEGGGDD